MLARAFGEITSLTARRQLRWIAGGTALGVGPFAVGYALPWALGFNPPVEFQLTAVPLGLVPLAFASAIVRYRLRDVEVIIKRGVAYTTFFAASAVLYVAMRKFVGFLLGEGADSHDWIIALLGTTIVVLLAQPVREALQNALDRLFYRDRYDYRRALVGFARDLNTDLDVVRLSQRLVTRIVETLLVDRMALMLADERSRRLQVHRRFWLRARRARASAGSRRSSAGSTRATRSHSTIRCRRRSSRPRMSSSGATRASSISCPASSKGPRSPCWRSAARRATSRSTAKTSGC